MEILNNNELSENNEITNYITEENQTNFLETSLGSTINSAMNLGLKALLPDCLENEVIDIKDTFLKEGFQEGVEKAINTAIDLGKNVLNIFNGKFTDISQAERAVKEGGLIDGISDVIDFILDKVENKGVISSNLNNLIKDGKEFILENISNNVKRNFENQISSIDNINSYSSLWKNYFSQQNMKKMDDIYEKLQDELEKVMPLDEVIKSAKQIENLNNMIKNNNDDFELTAEQIELSQVLV